MRHLPWATAFLGLWLCPNVLQAGLYNPAEPREGLLNADFRVFLNTLDKLRSIGLDQVVNDNPLRMRYILITESAPRVIPKSWNISRRLSLSAYLIRRQRFGEAIGLLKPLAGREERDNFLLLANLATAYHRDEPRGAVDYLAQALTVWPKKWKAVNKEIVKDLGWDEETFLRYREAETYFLKLLTLRARENRGGKSSKPPEDLDDLFKVRFVGDSGHYEAGKLAANEKAKLPDNALAVVQQLLVWLPDDARLFWLLGELYNAQGEVAVALQIFDSSQLAGLNGSFRPALLLDHLRVLKAAPAKTDSKPDPEQPPPDSVPPEDKKVLDGRALLIGFVAGMAVSFFAYWQIREWRRRRQSVSAEGK